MLANTSTSLPLAKLSYVTLVLYVWDASCIDKVQSAGKEFSHDLMWKMHALHVTAHTKPEGSHRSVKYETSECASDMPAADFAWVRKDASDWPASEVRSASKSVSRYDWD